MSQHPLHKYMLAAIQLSRRGFGKTAPNPCVGALLLKDTASGWQVLARGWHAAAGQDHAEVAALKDAAARGVDPAECTLLVTLEPCNHQGKTPPCTQAILEAGIKQVVVGACDPNPLAAGGAEFLRSRGVRVETGVAEAECLDNIADFLVWQKTSRPYLILKLASTLDGRIATSSGQSKWISCPETLERVHELRAAVQAVLVGGNTFYNDNPNLTCRPAAGPSPENQPLAVVITSRLPEAEAAFNLLQQRPADVIFWTSTAVAASPRAEALRRLGVRVRGLDYKGAEKNPFAQTDPAARPRPQRRGASLAAGRMNLDLESAVRELRAADGVHHLLCEGGGRLGLWLMEHGLVDEFRLHLSPKIVGDNAARPLFDGRSPGSMDEALQMRLAGFEPCGDDLLLTLRPARQYFEAAS